MRGGSNSLEIVSNGRLWYWRCWWALGFCSHSVNLVCRKWVIPN